MASKGIIDMMLKKDSIGKTWTWVANTTGKHATKSASAEDMREHALIRLIKL
jgi:hypothetical protein